MRSSILLAGIAFCMPSVWAVWAGQSPRASFTTRVEADSLLASQAIQTDPVAFIAISYDYVIVGAGTAGLAIAARLSENGKFSVGVLEAGASGLGVPAIDIPGYFGGDIGSIYDWNYTTATGKSSTGKTVPSVAWTRGKVLGGSSALNFMTWDRGSKPEYDAWESLGNPSWNWASMYYYMRKAETYTPPSSNTSKALGINPSSADYGHSGPIQVSFVRYVSLASSLWTSALVSLGLPLNNHPLAGSNVGAAQQPCSIDSNITRSYSTSAYLLPNAGQMNLKVLTGALASKIVWKSGSQGSGGVEASGVEFKSGGKTFVVKAKKEVILSTGVVGTPQLLELSGIGSAKVLSAVGIKQVVDLPNVGENVQDHAYAGVACERKASSGPTLDTLHSNATYAAEQLALYMSRSTSPPSALDSPPSSISYLTLEAIFGSKAAAQSAINAVTKYVHSSNAPYKATLLAQLDWLDKDVAQLEILNIDGFFVPGGIPEAGKTYTSFLGAQQHLFSRGTIHITSSDAAVYPTIKPNYFSVPFDIDILTAGVTYLRKIGNTKQYASIIVKEVVPGAALVGSALENFVTSTGFGGFLHGIGSASMLPRSKGGVVDPSLKVYGTANVRVVDASIIPVHFSGHPQATVYGIAEKAADIILGRHVF